MTLMKTIEIYIHYSRPKLIGEAYNKDVVESEFSHDYHKFVMSLSL